MRTVVLQTLFYSPDQLRDEHGRFGSGGGANFAEALTKGDHSGAEAWGNRNFGQWGDGLSSNSVDALYAYQGSDFRQLQAYVRADMPGPREYDPNLTPFQNRVSDNSREIAGKQSIIQGLDDAVASGTVTEAVTAYRAIDGANFGFPKDPSSLVGSTFSDKAFVSTSLGTEVPEQFASGKAYKVAQPMMVQVHVPEGTHAAFMPAIGDYGRGRGAGELTGGTHELLLGRNTQFRITGTSKYVPQGKSRAIPVIHVEVVNGR